MDLEIYSTEEQQVEAIKSWWKENGIAIVVGAALGLAGLFGWRYYNESQLRAQEEASMAYNRVTDALTSKGEVAFAETQSFISAHGKDSYGALASLQLAGAAVKVKNVDLAIEQLTLVANNSDTKLQAIANIRLARLYAEKKSFPDAIAALDKVKAESFKAQVSELRGDILLQQGNREGARSAYQAAADAGGLASSPALKLKMDDLTLAVTPVITEGKGNHDQAK